MADHDGRACVCPYCGQKTPEPNMRCRDRAMCAQRADYAYIRDGVRRV